MKHLLLLLLSAWLTTSCSSSPPENNAPADYPSVASQPDTIPFLSFTSGVRSFLEDSHGATWVGSRSEGVARIAGGETVYFTVADGLTDNQVRNIYEDQRGNVWFDCGIGVCYYDGSRIVTPGKRDFSSPEEWTFSPTDLWFKEQKTISFTEEEGAPGVYNYDGEGLTFYHWPIELGVDEINYYSLTTPPHRSPDGTIWFGTYGAVFGYDGKDWTVIDNEFAGRTEDTGYMHVRGIHVDRRGDLWITNNGGGVLHYDGKDITDFTKQHFPVGALPYTNSLDRAFSVGEDPEGNMWFGTVSSGIWRYDGEELTNYADAQGMPCDVITAIYRTKSGELWFAAEGPSGVYRFTGTAFERVL